MALDKKSKRAKKSNMQYYNISTHLQPYVSFCRSPPISNHEILPHCNYCCACFGTRYELHLVILSYKLEYFVLNYVKNIIQFNWLFLIFEYYRGLRPRCFRSRKAQWVLRCHEDQVDCGRDGDHPQPRRNQPGSVSTANSAHIVHPR